MSVGRYIATRIPTLVPPMNPAPNPFKALTLLNRQQWMFFLVRTILAEPALKHKTGLLINLLAGRFLRLDVGCLRFLHRLPDHFPAGQNL